MNAGSNDVVYCEIRYRLTPEHMPMFEEYSRVWIRLIERFGGRHFGVFLPRSIPAGAETSFPKLGAPGPADEAVALFGFESEEPYHAYREKVRQDP